jgi:hypothetical protein
MTFRLSGQMPSGKNQVKTALVKGKVIRFPDKRFKAWREASLQQLNPQCDWQGNYLPIQTPVRLCCNYTPGDLRVRDVSGLLDALFYLIVKAGILVDDGQVYEVIWLRQPVNREEPGLSFSLDAL